MLHQKLEPRAAAQPPKLAPGTAAQVTYYQTSGSEANDLALRICQIARPGARHVAVMGGAYHGMTTAALALSPYKFDSPGGLGRAAHVHVLPCPDTYRCAARVSGGSLHARLGAGGCGHTLVHARMAAAAAGEPVHACRGRHLDGRASARAAIAEAEAQGERICAFFCESVLSCAGQVALLAHRDLACTKQLSCACTLQMVRRQGGT